MKPRTLLRLYPAPWRERYGDEFVALLEKEGTGPRVVLSVAAGAFDAWMSPKTPSEMALDGPFGPGILFERGNMEVSARDRLSFVGLALGLGAIFFAVLDLLTDEPPGHFVFFAFMAAMQIVMPFLWLRFFSLRTRIAAAVWGPAVTLAFLAGLYGFARIVDWISRQ